MDEEKPTVKLIGEDGNIFSVLARTRKALQEAYNSALRSGQQWGIASIYAYSRMGEITRDVPKGQPLHKKYQEDPPSYGKQTKMKAEGIKTRTYVDAECIASHPEIRDRVIENAKKREEIPTNTNILRLNIKERGKI